MLLKFDVCSKTLPLSPLAFPMLGSINIMYFREIKRISNT